MRHFYRLLQDVYTLGNRVAPRGHDIVELIAQKLIIDNYNFMHTPEHREYDAVYKYWFAETAWYMSGDTNPDKIVRHAKMWGDIKNTDGTINSNYGHRVFYRQNNKGLSGFQFALNCLMNDKDSRNAIIIYNEPDLCFNGNKDFICSQSQHFLIRNDELICLIHLRSSDLIYGMYFNAPWWSLVQQQMLLNLLPLYPNLKIGRIEVFISSAHIYEKHWLLAEKILASPKQVSFIRWSKIIPLGKSFEWYFENLPAYFSTEKLP